jgi:hypothetical protein
MRKNDSRLSRLPMGKGKKLDRLVLVAKKFWKRNDSASMRRARGVQAPATVPALEVSLCCRGKAALHSIGPTHSEVGCGLCVPVWASKVPWIALRVGAGVDWHFVAACTQSGSYHALPGVPPRYFPAEGHAVVYLCRDFAEFPSDPPLEFGWKVAVWVSRFASRPDRSRCGHLDPCQNE